MGTSPPRHRTPCLSLPVALFMSWLLTGCSLAQTTPAQQLALDTDSVCRGVTVQFQPLAEADLRRMRARFVGNDLPTSTEIDYLFSGGASSFSRSEPAAFGVLLAAAIAFLLAAPILGSVFWFNTHFSTKKQPFLCISGATVLLLVSAVGLLVAQIVFAVRVEQTSQRVRCQIVRSGNLLVNGGPNPDSGNGYVGLTRIASALVALGQEYQMLLANRTVAPQVVQMNLQTQLESGLSALQSVAVQFSQASTANAFNRLSQGYSLKALTRWVSASAQSEFEWFRDTAQAFTDLGWAVSRLTDTSRSNIGFSVIQTINFGLEFLNGLANDLSTFTEGVDSRQETSSAQVRGGFWTSFCFVVATILILGRVSLGTFRGILKSKEGRTSFAPSFRCNLILCSILVAGLSSIILLMKAGLTGTSVLCSVVSHSNVGQRSFLDSQRKSWAGFSKFAVHECLDSRGQLHETAWLDGRSAWAPYLADFWGTFKAALSLKSPSSGPFRLGSRALEFLGSNYTLIRQGVLADTSSVELSLRKLAGYLGPAGWSVCLTSSGCPGSSPNWLVIDSANTFPVDPSSPNYQQSRTLFQNLRAYIQSEQAVLASLIAALIPTTAPSSPNYIFATAQKNLESIRPALLTIMSLLPATAAALGSQPGDGQQLFDCRNVRVELLTLEDQLCFQLPSLQATLFWLSVASLCVLGLAVVLASVPLAFHGLSRHASRSVVPLLPPKSAESEQEVGGEAHNPIH